MFFSAVSWMHPATSDLPNSAFRQQEIFPKSSAISPEAGNPHARYANWATFTAVRSGN